MAIKKQNIKLLSSDFSGLHQKTVYDFIGVDGVKAFNAINFDKIGGFPDDPVAIMEYKKLMVDNPSENSSDLLALASSLRNAEFKNAVLSQFVGVVPLSE